jgi:hypothetical protein
MDADVAVILTKFLKKITEAKNNDCCSLTMDDDVAVILTKFLKK